MRKEAKEVKIGEKILECPICNHKKFWKRQTLMNTAGATFFGFDWANKEAVNFICNSCGYIMWFWVG
ncbi:hypothetical protein [Anaerobranca gottschalkii]|uniref:Nucleic-acid-binding protein containing Zn-ribbon domain n=1 Tax=Anaerobranca gottschalkii DSM 13577 TaxID=1120990 RepID=A0A1I0A253_9FIRM|nr:hypothetical protein [Anaerobranca gottschalkii]SES88139.1 hypothetical protein SAMN03080614_101622 [Anaerobranca gottschalkii DSM 13577]